MSRGLNEGRGSGAPRILNLGTERSTVACEEDHPKGKLPATVVSKPRRPLGVLLQGLCVFTQFRIKPFSCNEFFVSSFYLAPAMHLSDVPIFAVVKNILKILVDWLQSSYFMSCILSIIRA
jgi:hypothetical protein